jgi:hypothetical protein
MRSLSIFDEYLPATATPVPSSPPRVLRPVYSFTTGTPSLGGAVDGADGSNNNDNYNNDDNDNNSINNGKNNDDNKDENDDNNDKSNQETKNIQDGKTSDNNSDNSSVEQNSRYNKMIISTLIRCLQGFKDKENETTYNEVRHNIYCYVTLYYFVFCFYVTSLCYFSHTEFQFFESLENLIIKCEIAESVPWNFLFFDP